MELLYGGKGLAERLALARRLGHKMVLVLEAGACEGADVLPATHVRNAQEARKAKTRAVIAPATRECFESKRVTHILAPEIAARPDFIHHRNSGLNQVLLRLCRRTGKSIIVPLNELGSAERLGRAMQNARWCARFGVPYHIVSGARHWWQQRAAGDLQALRRELLRR